MPIVLYRVDERLLHGQVVVGWGGHLHPDRYVVVDDALMDSAWERELYALGVPEGVEVVFARPTSALEHLEEWRASPLRTVLLTRDLGTMAQLARGARMAGEEVNVGGLHAAPGRVQVLPYVHLAPEDRLALEELRREGVRVVARDLPGSRGVPAGDWVP